jgi:hypothetical protein
MHKRAMKGWHKPGPKSRKAGAAKKSTNPWIKAVQEARKRLGVKDFEAVRTGGQLWREAKAIQAKAALKAKRL